MVTAVGSPEEPKCFEYHYDYMNNDSLKGHIPSDIAQGPCPKTSLVEAAMVRAGIELGIASVSVCQGISVVGIAKNKTRAAKEKLYLPPPPLWDPV